MLSGILSKFLLSLAKKHGGGGAVFNCTFSTTLIPEFRVQAAKIVAAVN